jgi:hypothetical protein
MKGLFCLAQEMFSNIQYDIGHLHKLSENKVEKVAGFSSVRDRVQGVRPPHGPAQQAVQGEPTFTHGLVYFAPL